MSSQREPCELTCAGHDASGAELSFVLKGHIWPQEQTVFWNLLPVVSVLTQQRNLRLHKWLQRDACVFMEAVGGFDGPHIKQSQRASSASAGVHEDGQATQEYTVSSHGLILLMVIWHSSRRYHKDKVRGAACLELTLKTLLDPDDVGLEFPKLSNRLRCQKDVEASGLCTHLHEVWSSHVQRTAAPQARIASCMLELYSQKCDAASSCFSDMMRAVDGAISNKACSGEYAHDLLLALGMHGSKRRRLDEDVKAHLISTYGRAKVGSSAQAVVTAPSSTVLRWSAEMLAGYLEAGHRSCQATSAGFSIAFDASRFGVIREETLAFAAWDSTSRLAMWLPIQVPE